MLNASRSFLKVPSLLESSMLRLKSWPCRIVSMISSASTLVASTRFSSDSMESCFTGCLKYKHIQDFTKRFFYKHILQEVLQGTHTFTCWLWSHCGTEWSSTGVKVYRPVCGTPCPHWALVGCQSQWRHCPQTSSSYERAPSGWSSVNDLYCSLQECPDWSILWNYRMQKVIE